MNIRPYQDADLRLFQQLVYEAQERDCKLDRWMATAQRMLGDYLTGLFEDLRKYKGVILVAETDGGDAGPTTAGFIAVLGACTEHDVDETDHAFGFITDLVVREDVDVAQVASLLIGAAEQHAARCGSEVIRSSVLARNTMLLAHYRNHDFSERVLQFEKTITTGD